MRKAGGMGVALPTCHLKAVHVSAQCRHDCGNNGHKMPMQRGYKRRGERQCEVKSEGDEGAYC